MRTFTANFGGYGTCGLTMRSSGPWFMGGRTLVANRLLAGSACGKRRRADRKSVVLGKSVDLGGRRIIKKKGLDRLTGVARVKRMLVPRQRVPGYAHREHL